MNFTFSEDQEIFRDAFKKYLESNVTPEKIRSGWEDNMPFNQARWQELEELGILQSNLDEKYGGLGLDLVTSCLLVEEMGYYALPEPAAEQIFLSNLLINKSIDIAALIEEKNQFIGVTHSLSPNILFLDNSSKLINLEEDSISIVSSKDINGKKLKSSDPSRDLTNFISENSDSGLFQTLNDQVALLDVVFQRYEKLSIVGHSFGGSVAMMAAKKYPEKVKDLILIEPNPFYLLRQNSYWGAFDEAQALRDTIKTAGNTGSWEIAAAYFADYWNGAGSWQGMDQQRQKKFITALKPNFHEWDCVMHEDTSLDEWKINLPSDTTILSSDKTVNSISSLVELFKTSMSSWSFQSYTGAGHMAPLTHPQMINPIINNLLLKT